MRIQVLLFFIVVGARSAGADFVISPYASQNFSSASAPFFVDTNYATSVRYQQVYGGSDFARRGSPQYLITEIQFSPGPDSGPIDIVLPNVEINLSTTPRSVDSLSPVFGSNVGLDNTLVYSGQLHMIARADGIHILLQRPFLYAWSAGNLLMDVRNYQTVRITPPPPLGPPLLMGVSTLGDTVSLASAFDVSSATATFLGTGGLLTAFTVTGVPEPGSAWLLLVGLGALVLLKWRSRTRVHTNCRLIKTPRGGH
jgi:hypothetical protein